MEEIIKLKALLEVLDKLQLAANILIQNNHKLDENLTSEYDLALEAIGFTQGYLTVLASKVKPEVEKQDEEKVQ